jgi:hypothetical protein
LVKVGSGWKFQVLTVLAVKKGDEALLEYTEGLLPGWQMLLQYGFVPTRFSNEHVRIFGGLGEAIDWYMQHFSGEVQPKPQQAPFKYASVWKWLSTLLIDTWSWSNSLTENVFTLNFMGHATEGTRGGPRVEVFGKVEWKLE